MQEEDNNQPQAGWVFQPGGESPTVPQPNLSDNTEPNPASQQSLQGAIVSWSASEYIANPKNTNWFAMLAASSLVLTVIVYFLTKDIVSVVVIIMLGIIVGIFAARQPQVLEYNINSTGIMMGPRFYPFESFKSFSVADEGPLSHISLLPLKRFMPPIALHYAPDDEEKIINALADYLPYEEHKRDIVENFSRRVRF